jgi:hypothetical protein
MQGRCICLLDGDLNTVFAIDPAHNMTSIFTDDTYITTPAKAS